MNALNRDRRGAIYVEFLIAFMPLFVFFMCLIQMVFLSIGQLMTMHAAECAARAAIVVFPDDPSRYDSSQTNQIEGKRRNTVYRAATVALAPVSVVAIKLTFPSTQGGDDDQTSFGRDDLIRVKLEALYKCQVPIAKFIVCNPMTGTRKLKAEAALPNQGADYSYD